MSVAAQMNVNSWLGKGWVPSAGLAATVLPGHRYVMAGQDGRRGGGSNPPLNAAVDVRDRLVIAAVVDIARGMGKKTIAEFVTDKLCG